MENYPQESKAARLLKRMGQILWEAGVALGGHSDATAGLEIRREQQTQSDLLELQDDGHLARTLDQWRETHGA